VSAQTDISHHNTILKYTKQIGDTYYYVEEIRKRNKSLAFKSLIKREKEKTSKERG
jgi:deferrochelatase/peroxidase EfeB